MKLIDLIQHLESEEALLKFYNANNFPTETEAISAFMADSLDIDSDIFFFPVEETGEYILFEKDGRKYFELFSLELGVEFYSYFDETFKTGKYTDLQKAKRLLEYLINDA